MSTNSGSFASVEEEDDSKHNKCNPKSNQGMLESAKVDLYHKRLVLGGCHGPSQVSDVVWAGGATPFTAEFTVSSWPDATSELNGPSC